MISSALLSLCGTYRWELRRSWNGSLPLLVVVMLNPSTADAEKDDPTIKALIWFASQWGYGGIWIVNLRAYRTSQPSELFARHAQGVNTIGPENYFHVGTALEYARGNTGKVLVAWGTGGSDLGLDAYVVALAFGKSLELICLGKNADGSPKHPMARGKHRIPRDQQPISWYMPQ